jgi:hypothetical protein
MAPSGLPYTPLLLLLQCLAWGYVDMPKSQEEVIQAREAAMTTVAACAMVVRATEASA